MKKHSLLRSALCMMVCFLLPFSAEAKHNHFKVSVYVRALFMCVPQRCRR